jgi:UDP-GlcNAc:undecaprenyl-phosphate GlcNAc-1-phosphate transferase
MVLTGWAKGDKLKAIIIPCCILVVPLYDITLSTILRLKNRVVKGVAEAIAYCGRDHITHRLCALGLTQIQTVILLYFLGAMGGAIGAFIFHDWVTKQIYLPIVAGSIIVLIVFGAILDRAKVYPNKD